MATGLTATNPRSWEVLLQFDLEIDVSLGRLKDLWWIVRLLMLNADDGSHGEGGGWIAK